MAMEAMLVLRMVKLVADQVKEIIKNNKETKEIMEGLLKDLFLVELVADEIQKSGVKLNPRLQKAMNILHERLGEITETLEALQEKRKKWVQKIFQSKQMLKQAAGASEKLADELEALPAAFETERFAQDIAFKDASNNLSEAINFFLTEKTANSLWKDLEDPNNSTNSVNPPFQTVYQKLANAFPDLLDQKFSEGDMPRKDAFVIADAIGIEAGPAKGTVPLVKFAKWVEGRTLDTAISQALMKSMQSDFSRRRKKLLCPDLEIFWVGPHLAEFENREMIRKCFEDLVGGGHTFNVTFASNIPEAEKTLEIGSRLIGQMACGRVIVVTTMAMANRLKEMIEKSRYKDAKVIKDTKAGATSSAVPAAADVAEVKTDSPIPPEAANSAISSAAKVKIVAYHSSYKSCKLTMSLPEYIVIGNDKLKEVIMTQGASLKVLDEEQKAQINEEMEKLYS